MEALPCVSHQFCHAAGVEDQRTHHFVQLQEEVWEEEDREKESPDTKLHFYLQNRNIMLKMIKDYVFKMTLYTHPIVQKSTDIQFEMIDKNDFIIIPICPGL